MRVLTERLRDRELDLTDGIKVFDERGWAQVLPDPDEPLVHIYAEGETEEDSDALEAELRALVEEIMQAEEHADAPRLKPQVEVDPSAACALLAGTVIPDERRLWNRFPISHRCPTTSSSS